MNKTTKIILFCLVFFILTFLIVIQARTIKNSEITYLSSYKSDDLIDEFFKWKNKYEDVNETIQEQEVILKDYEHNNREY